MASTATNEAEASDIRRRGRRRLIGAIVLVALAVVFVPMLLDSEPRPARPGPTTSIPSKANVAPLPPPSPAKTPTVAAAPEKAPAEPEKAPVEPEKAAEAKPLSPAPATVAQPAQPAGKAPAPPPSAPAGSKAADAPRLEGYAVQVGAFRDDAKLAQSREKLAGAGVVHYTERLDAKAGPLTRLRAGPFATREEAEAALVKLKRASIEGKVVPLP